MKERGKIYRYGTTIVLCTGKGIHDQRFAGVVIGQENSSGSEIRIGNYSETWNTDVFREYEGEIILDNKNWKPYVEIGTSPG